MAYHQAKTTASEITEDLHYAHRLAKTRPALTVHEVELTSDIDALLPLFGATLDEPVGDSAALNVFLMCRAARARGITVLLSGMGADEMFGGYRRHRACLYATRWRTVPPWLRSPMTRAARALPVTLAGHDLPATRRLKRFMDFASLPEDDAYLRSFSYYDLPTLARLMPAFPDDLDARLLAPYRQTYHTITDNDPVRRMLFTDLHYFLPGLNLAYTDRASMAASCEIRVPFADHHVAALALRCRGREAVTMGAGKKMLKKAAERWLPRDIIHRPKHSFSLPLRRWMAQDLYSRLHDTLPRGMAVQQGYLNEAFVTAMLRDHRAGRHDYAQPLWQCLTLEMWLSTLLSHGAGALQK